MVMYPGGGERGREGIEGEMEGWMGEGERRRGGVGGAGALSSMPPAALLVQSFQTDWTYRLGIINAPMTINSTM